MNRFELWTLILAFASIMIAGVTVPILLMLWSNRRDNNRRHTENLRKFDMIIIDRKQHVPHSHKKVRGTLLYEDITWSAIKINGDGG